MFSASQPKDSHVTRLHCAMHRHLGEFLRAPLFSWSTSLWRGTRAGYPFAGNAESPRRSLYYDDFSRALHPRTMETGKTIERQARGRLPLLNNFCVLKLNRVLASAFVARVVGRDDTISALEREFDRVCWTTPDLPADSSSSSTQTTGGSNYFLGIHRPSHPADEAEPRVPDRQHSSFTRSTLSTVLSGKEWKALSISWQVKEKECWDLSRTKSSGFRMKCSNLSPKWAI